MRTGFIGLGAMGQPLAGHLQSRGLLGVVGNRTAGKAERVATDLLVRAATSADDFADCDVVVLCVSADADVLANVQALSSVLAKGSVVIDHSTVASGTAKKAHALLAGRVAVSPADVQRVAIPVLRHRVLPNYAAEADGIASDAIVKELMVRVEPSRGVVPR